MSSAGPRDFVCTGAISGYVNDSARTIALKSATSNAAAGGVGMQNGTGNIAVSLDSGSSITSAGTGLSMITTGGAVNVSTPAGTGINGSISSGTGAAIAAAADGVNNGVTITTGSGATLSGWVGLSATANNNGAVNLGLGASVTAARGDAIDATTYDGAINITAAAPLSAFANGVTATTQRNGLIAVTTSDVTSMLGTAISAIAGGSGNVTVYSTGVLTATAGAFGDAVLAQSVSGNVTITALGAVTSAGGGILASTGGAGTTNVSTGAALTANSGDGVNATSVNGPTIVQIGGAVTASGNGVVVSSSGKGSVTAGVHANVTGAAGAGVSASSSSGALEIDLDSGTFVAGKTTGVSASTQSGTATISNAATVTGSATGASVTLDANKGSAILNNSGVITSVGGGAVSVLSGVATIRNSGTIDGTVTRTLGSVSTMTNSGVWTNAAGSTVTNLNKSGAITFGPAGGAVGTITVVGAATFSGGTLNARVAATTVGGVTTITTDTLVVGGKTTINGGVITLTGATGALTVGSRLTLLTSAGGVTGSFSGVASSGSLAGYVTSDATSVYVTMLNRDFRASALNRNQLAVANAIYNGSAVLANAAGGKLLYNLNNASSAAIPGALTQLSGDGVVTGAANAALQAGHLFTSLMEDQTDIWESGGAPANSITLQEPFAYAPRVSADSKWPVSRQQYAPPAPRPVLSRRTWRVWASGFGGQTRLQGDTNSGATNQVASVVGGAMGVDYQAGQHTLIGATVGYSSSAFSAATTNVTGSTNGLHVGAYAGMHVGAFYGNASLAYGGYSNSTKRQVSPIGGGAAETDTATFTSEEVRTRLEIGRKLSFEATSITPFTAIEVAHIHTHSFSESGIASDGTAGIYALSFNGQGANSVPTFIGMKAESRIDTGPVVLTPWISVAWRHEWSTGRTQTATLIALPTSSFQTIGAKASSNALQLKGGLDVQVTQTATLYATFEGELLSKNPVYAGRGGVRVGW